MHTPLLLVPEPRPFDIAIEELKRYEFARY
jgi:hypothetical protein